MKSKYETVLHALLASTPIKIENHTFKLFKPNNIIELPSGTYLTDTYWIGIEMLSGDKKVYVGSDLSITQFLNYIDSLPDEEIKKIEDNRVIQCMNNTIETCKSYATHKGVK